MLVLPIKKKWFDMIKSGENNEDYKEIYDYIKKLEDELKIIIKDFEKIYCENQKLKQELDKLKENRI